MTAPRPGPPRDTEAVAPAPPSVALIANAWADTGVVTSGDAAWSWTRSGAGPRPADAAWTTSIGAGFGDMARDEARRLPGTLARLGMGAAASALRPIVRTLDPVVMLDSAGLSTQLHAPASFEVLDAAADALARAHPGVTRVVRSLDARQSPGWLSWARARGWYLVPMRRVWYQDPRDPALWRRRNTRHDAVVADRQLASGVLRWRPLTAADAEVAVALYAQLYLEKYSRHNPRFTAAWLATGLASGWLQGDLLLRDGRPVAVLAGWRQAGFMTFPVFGYDLRAPAHDASYRLLSLRALERAREAGDVLHASAGADDFKASRGGIPELEYLAVSVPGRPRSRRHVWRTLRWAALHAARFAFRP